VEPAGVGGTGFLLLLYLQYRQRFKNQYDKSNDSIELKKEKEEKANDVPK
jgi:hypothetical protein